MRIPKVVRIKPWARCPATLGTRRGSRQDNGIMAAVRSMSVCPWHRLAMEPVCCGLLGPLDESLLEKGSAVLLCGSGQSGQEGPAVPCRPRD